MLYGRQPKDEPTRPGTDAGGDPSPSEMSPVEDLASTDGTTSEAATSDTAEHAHADGPDPDPPPEPRPVDPHPDQPGGPDEDEEEDDPIEVPGPSDPDPDLDPDDPDEPEEPDLDPDADPIEDDPLSPRASADGVDPIFRRGGLSLGDTPDAERKAKRHSRDRSATPPGGSDRGIAAHDRTDASGASEEMRERTLDGVPVRERISAGTVDASAASETSAEEASDGPVDPVFRPDLESYSGPFELLLYLIHKDEVDIFDIPIAHILKQFLAHVRRLEANGTLDLQDSGEYLVMAARLMEIKSRMLLPNDSDEEEDLLEAEVEDPRWSLVQQLLEFSAIKQRAQLLELAHRNRSQCYERLPGDLPPPEPGSLELKETSSLDLRAAFQRVLDLLRERDAVRVVPGEEIPIEVAMSGIREQLVAATGRRRPFSELFPSELGLRGLVSYFMALLELTRLRHLQLEQEDDFGDILVILREAA